MERRLSGNLDPGVAFLTGQAERPTYWRIIAGTLVFLAVLFALPVSLDPADQSAFGQVPPPSGSVEAHSGPPAPTYPPDYKIPILMYHDVGPVANGLTVTLKMLAEQMDALEVAGYQTVSLEAVMLALRGEPVNLPEKGVVLTFDDAYTGVYRDAYPILKEHGFTATLFVITGLVDKAGYVTWDEVCDLADAGWTIGSHTVRHLDLRLLTGQRLETEISSAREVLQEKTGQSVLAFCYPSGKYNDLVIEAVKAAGYYGAVTTAPGVASLLDPQFTLKRVRVDGRDALATFKAKLSIP